MDNLLCEVRFEEATDRLSPGRLTGTLLTYEVRARDRAELFARGALSWPEHGIVINEQHNRQASIVRAVPFLDGDALKIDVALPDTQRGRDAAINTRGPNPLYRGLSVEFFAESEGRRGSMREIRRAVLAAAALVDSPSYADSKAEVRERSGPYWQLDQEMLRWL